MKNIRSMDIKGWREKIGKLDGVEKTCEWLQMDAHQRIGYIK